MTNVRNMSILSPSSIVSFTLNGLDVKLSGVDPNVTLNEWIRSQHGLSGTKKMCGEGGCGCCVVSVLRKDPTTGKDTTIAINSVSSAKKFIADTTFREQRHLRIIILFSCWM